MVIEDSEEVSRVSLSEVLSSCREYLRGTHVSSGKSMNHSTHREDVSDDGMEEVSELFLSDELEQRWPEW